MKKLTIEFITEQLKKKWYILKTTEYKNSTQKLECICPKGHHCVIIWSEWRRGHGCSYCAGNLKKTIKNIYATFEKEGFILKTTKYENAFQKLDYICPNGHHGVIRWNDWQQGHRCKICSFEKHAMKRRKDFNVIIKTFNDENCVLKTVVSEYKNGKQKLNYICPNGHHHSVTWDGWKKGRRCPHCVNKNVSKWEIEIKKFISGIKVEFVANDKTQLINPNTNCALELDVWFPQLSKAIECNGVYWHSSEQAVIRDKIKQQLCIEQGIDLLVITDKEWKSGIEDCKMKLTSFIGAGALNV